MSIYARKETMRFVLFIFTGLTATAHAQWGSGLFGGSSCPNQFAPGRGAINGGDELMNLTGQLAARNQRIDNLKDKEERVNEYLKDARGDMAAVLTPAAIAAIKEHRE